MSKATLPLINTSSYPPLLPLDESDDGRGRINKCDCCCRYVIISMFGAALAPAALFAIATAATSIAGIILFAGEADHCSYGNDALAGLAGTGILLTGFIGCMTVHAVDSTKTNLSARQRCGVLASALVCWSLFGINIASLCLYNKCS